MFLPISKMLPILGGSGGSFVEFWVWFNFLRMKIIMSAKTELVTD